MNKMPKTTLLAVGLLGLALSNSANAGFVSNSIVAGGVVDAEHYGKRSDEAKDAAAEARKLAEDFTTSNDYNQRWDDLKQLNKIGWDYRNIKLFIVVDALVDAKSHHPHNSVVDIRINDGLNYLYIPVLGFKCRELKLSGTSYRDLPQSCHHVSTSVDGHEMFSRPEYQPWQLQ